MFDLFHTLVDPEDFRPRNFHRAEVAADILGVDREAFLRYWNGINRTRYVSTRPVLALLLEFLETSGKRCSNADLEKAVEAMGRY